MYTLSNLSPSEGSTHRRKRVGRGPSSGNGKTAGRGQKGQKSRSGGSPRVGFEGGQMPLTRRLPKRGFNNNFRKVYSIVNLSAFNNFEAGSVIDKAALLEKGLIKEVKNDAGLKVLASGEINVAVTVKAAKFSESAKEAIEKAGGKAEIE